MYTVYTIKSSIIIKGIFWTIKQTYLNPALQRLSIFSLEGVWYVSKVDLAPCDHDADELAIVGAQAFHRLVQTFREEHRLVADAFHCKLEWFV